MIKRIFDFIASFVLLILILIPCLVIGILIKLSSEGPILHWSKRIGQNNQIFLMPKFRSMFVNTPQVATHLLQNSSQHITWVGRILRKTSLDELPQILSVLKGDMSLVGPRPALFNQDDLVSLRSEHGVEKLKPGITGWAQVNGRDELSIPVKVQYDFEYLKKQSFLFDIKILFLTFYKIIKSENVTH